MATILTSELQGNPTDAVKFLISLRPKGPWTLGAIPPDGGVPETTTFTDPEDARKWIAPRDGKVNLYFSLNPMRSLMTTKPGEADVESFVGAHIDCDPSPDETATNAQKRIRAALKAYRTPPTIIYTSGNGVVGLWMLNEPVPVEGAVDIARCKGVNIALRDALAGDKCQSLDHLLRLPFTVNIPNAKKRAAGRVAVVAGDVEHFPTRTYAFDELPNVDVILIAECEAPSIGAPEAVDVEDLPVSDEIKELIRNGTDGDRSEAVYRVVRAMHSARVSAEEMLGIFTDERYSIGERFRERGDYAEEAARKDIARVIGKHMADLAQDFAEPLETDHLPDDARHNKEGDASSGKNEVTPIERRGIKVNNNSKAEDTYTNAFIAVSQSGLDPAWNEMSQSVVFRKAPWNPSHGLTFNDHTLRIVRLFLSNAFQGNAYEPSEKHVFDAIMAVAYQQKFNPVLDYLAGLTWDGVPRLDRLFSDYFRCGDTPYTRAVSACFGIGAVRRMRQPGCKLDTMPVVKGPQGWGKSTGVQAFFGRQWFTDADMGSLKDKDAGMKIRGVWCVEFAEIDSLTKVETGILKAFMSRGTDRQRDPYGRIVEDHPRRCVFLATVNEGGYLKDSTGARRFWPLELTDRVDVAHTTADRDQLWAEAAAREAARESHVLPQALWSMAAEEQARQTTDDPWVDVLRVFLDGRERDWDAGEFETFSDPADEPRPPDRVFTWELFNALHITAERRTKGQSQRLRTVMESAMGWKHNRNIHWRGEQGKGYTRTHDVK